ACRPGAFHLASSFLRLQPSPQQRIEDVRAGRPGRRVGLERELRRQDVANAEGVDRFEEADAVDDVELWGEVLAEHERSLAKAAGALEGRLLEPEALGDPLADQVPALQAERRRGVRDEAP